MLSNQVFLPAIVLAAAFSTSSSSVCHGQTNIQPRWTDSTITKVKPEMRREFETYLKQLMGAYKKAGAPWFLTRETFAGDTTEYTTVVPVMKFGDLDGATAVERVLGEVGWEHLSRNIARCYTAQMRMYATPQTELEINKTDVPMGMYWIETTTVVAPGRMGDYLKWLQNDYRPALEKAGVAHFQVSQPIFGAAAGEVMIRRMLKNLGEVDEGPVLSKALNEEDARAVAAKAGALVSASTTRIVRLRADLSYSAGR
jgi:hypothetical protein